LLEPITIGLVYQHNFLKGVSRNVANFQPVQYSCLRRFLDRPQAGILREVGPEDASRVAGKDFVAPIDEFGENAETAEGGDGISHQMEDLAQSRQRIKPIPRPRREAYARHVFAVKLHALRLNARFTG